MEMQKKPPLLLWGDFKNLNIEQVETGNINLFALAELKLNLLVKKCSNIKINIESYSNYNIYHLKANDKTYTGNSLIAVIEELDKDLNDSTKR